MRRLYFGTVVVVAVVGVVAAGAVRFLPGLQGPRESLSQAVGSRIDALRTVWAPRPTSAPATLAEIGARIRGPMVRGTPSLDLQSGDLASGAVQLLALVAAHGGHRTIENRAGERMTVADAAELRRAFELLAPGSLGRPEQLHVVLADDVVTTHREQLDGLPEAARLSVMVDGVVYRLHRRVGQGPDRWWAEIYPGLSLQLSDRDRFLEARRRLLAPLDGRGPALATLVRAAESGGTKSYSGAGAEQLVVPVETMGAALRGRAGGVVLFTGDLRGGGVVEMQPSGGGLLRLPLARLLEAASRANVDLVLLAVGTPRQAGERNWLWLRRDVAGLEGARAPHLAALAVRLAGRRGGVRVTAEPGATRDRLAFRFVPEWSAGTGLGGVLDGMAAQVTGTLAVESIRAEVMSERRRAEIALRIVPSLPAWLQLGYLMAFVVGFCGLRVARAWWDRLWPPPTARSFMGIVRELVFWSMFLPAVGVPALLARLPFRHSARRREVRVPFGVDEPARPLDTRSDTAVIVSARRRASVGDAPLGRLDDGGP